MENVVLTIHLILALLLIGVVLLQRSEGGGLGMGGGGVMSARGAANALSRLTWIFAVAFIATSITLTVLAARDARCVVVGTRTEIDWARRNGQAVVWAPSKIVLDAVDGPKVAAADGAALALWLAETLGAERFIVHGDVAVPAGSRVTVERV